MYVSLRKTASQLFGRFVSLSALNLSFAQSVSLLVGQLFSQAVRRSVSQSVNRSVSMSLDHLFIRSVWVQGGITIAQFSNNTCIKTHFHWFIEHFVVNLDSRAALP